MYKISYICDGVTAEFIFNFPFFQEDDVHVALNGDVLDKSLYGLNMNAALDGGTIAFATAPADGIQIDIFRQIELSRIVDYQPTAKIDPENLNADFNFLLEAFRDLKAVDMDLSEWQNTHNNVKKFLDYTVQLIEDKLSGGSVLGLYNNLLSVLDNALPKLINDYGSVADAAGNENSDDYGLL